jgi:predicted GIY-YIG superfamily endonuclease
MSRSPRKAPTGHVYLIHFQCRYRHAGHYLGFATDLEQRLVKHRGGNGARLMEVIGQAGITWKLVRVWTGDRNLERRLKSRKNTPRQLCPVCRGDTDYEAVEEQGLLPSGSQGAGAAPFGPESHGPSDEDDPPF